jgi:hypothetical protein
MTKLLGDRTFTSGDRLFTIIEYICVNTDMEQHAFRRTIADPEKQGYAFVSQLFDLKIAIPVNGPFVASFKGLAATHTITYELKIAPNDMPKDTQRVKSDAFGGVTEIFWNMILVFFYERHRRWIEGLGDPDKWPSLLRFARQLRNAGAHHAGRLNITSKKAPLIEWYHLRLAHKDNGTKILGNLMQPGDYLLFLIELSDELDKLKCLNRPGFVGGSNS